MSFYQDIKTSVAPLLIHVRRLPTVLSRYAVADTAAPEATLRDTGHSLVEDFATARDLVRRLTPPAHAGRAHRLYEAAVLLYIEAARVVESLAALAPAGGTETAEQARSGLRLRVLGDRLFDEAKRQLGLQPDDAHLPPPIPDIDGAVRQEASWAAAHNAADRAERLRLIAARLDGKTDIDLSRLYVGGAFNGSPPPLTPGADPAEGVPGGLPRVDAAAILGG